jgi:hypothetical protein
MPQNERERRTHLVACRRPELDEHESAGKRKRSSDGEGDATVVAVCGEEMVTERLRPARPGEVEYFLFKRDKNHHFSPEKLQ